MICRYGVPTCLRVDRGSEFKGKVVRYCKSMGIALTPIATQNPRANGMVERMVVTVKSAICRCMTTCPEFRWWEALPDVVWGIRMLSVWDTGLSPFLL